MRKILLTAVAMLMTVTMMAIGKNDGSTKANAIDFDWDKGNEQEAGTLWYRVSLDPLYDMDVPTLALYMTNLVNEEVNVTLEASLMGEHETKSYIIAPKDHRTWSVGASMLVQTNQREVFLTLTSDKKVALSAKVYETEDMDDACLSALEFNWTTGASLAANKEQWYKIDLSAAKAATNKQVALTVVNKGTATANLTTDLSLDCPSSGLTTYTGKLAAGASQTKEVARTMLDMLKDDFVYVRVLADQPILLSATLVDVPTTPVFDNCGDAQEVALETTYTVATGTHLFKVPVAILRGDSAHRRHEPEVTLTNVGSAKATITAKLAFACPATSAIEKSLTLGAGAEIVKAVEKNMVEGIDPSQDYIYVQVTTNQPLTIYGRLKHVNEGNACKNSKPFDWTNGHAQSAGTVWYAVDITEAKNQVKNIELSLTNNATTAANITAEVAFACPYTDLQTTSRTIAAKTTLTRTIDYGMFGMMGGDVIYVGLTTDQSVKFSAKLTEVETTQPDDACLTATNFDWVNGHTQAAGVSTWYKLAVADIKQTGYLPYISITNNGTATATIDGEISLDCPDAVANTKQSMTIAAGKTASKQLDRTTVNSISSSIDTIYIKVTSSQSITFKAEMKEEEKGATCATAIDFDWTNGAVQVANTTLWYAINIADAKANKLDITLALTNNGTKKATVTADLALDCPYTELQTITREVTAGTTISKTIEYSTFGMMATNVIYVRVTSNQAISLTATTQPTTVGPVDDACLSAIPFNLTTGHVQAAGTTVWYKAAVADFTAAGKVYTLAVTNNGTATATIQGELSVECPDSLANTTKTTTVAAGAKIEKVLAQDMLNGLDASIDTVYVKVTTNQDITFGVTVTEQPAGATCANAIAFDWQNGINIVAGQETWYSVDITEAKAKKQDIVLTLVNNSANKANITASIAYECPFVDFVATEKRTVAAQTTIEKTIEYGTFSMLETNTLYVRVLSTGDLTVTAITSFAPVVGPDPACLYAIPFDWTYGHKQLANTTAWYKVATADMNNAEKLPVAVLTNLGSAKATIEGELSIECPDSLPNTKHSMTLAVGAKYEKQLSRDMVSGISADTLYIKVTTNQDVAFELKMEQENPGLTCHSAIPFNWVSGNHHAAGTEQWYLIDLKEVHKNHYNVKLTLKNKDAVAGEVTAALAPTCPCDVPQVETRTLSANQESTRELAYSSLETFGDTIYVKINSSVNLYLSAEMVTSGYFEPITACENAIPFAWNTLYSQAAGDTVWYYLNPGTLNSDTTLTPRLHLINGGAANSIKASISYHCPVTYEMTTQSISMTSGQEIYKMLERSLASQVATKDSVLIQLIGTAAFSFSAELVNPNTGVDCAHATLLNVGDSIVQEAATTKWYKMHVASLKSMNKLFTFAMENLDGKAGKVDVALHTACDSAAMASRALTLGAYEVLSRQISSESLKGLAAEYMYLSVTAAQQLMLSMTMEEPAPVDTIVACENAIAVVPNITYSQQAGDTTWYYVSLDNLRNTTQGNGTLTVRNLGVTTANTTAEVAWACPVVHEMVSQSRSILAGDSLTYEVTRDMINNTTDSVVYIRVTTNQPITFDLTIQLSKGDNCYNAIPFDMVNGHVHPGGEKLWYQVELDSTVIPENKDLRLYIENLVSNNTSVYAELYFDCNDQPIEKSNYTFAPNDLKFKDIDRDILKGLGWAPLLIHYTSDNNTKIYVQLIDTVTPTPIFDTIYDYVCDGTYYTDTITGVDHLIMSGDVTTLTWNDTVKVNDGTFVRDHITTFIITPILPVQPVTKAILDSLQANPLLVQGMVPVLDASASKIKAYYASIDDAATADVDSVWWELVAPKNLDLTQAIPRNTKTVSLVLKVKDNCSNNLVVSNPKTMTFTTENWQVITENFADTVCAGAESALLPGVIINNDTVITHTIQDLVHPDTLGLPRMYDSVTVYTIEALLAVPVTTVHDTICNGDTYTWSVDGQTYSGTQTVSVTLQDIHGCDSVVTLELVELPAVPVTTVHDTICNGDTYTWSVDGQTYSGTQTVSVTLQDIHGCDSIVTLELVELPAVVYSPVSTVAICDGDSYTWSVNNAVYTVAGLYNDTIKNSLGCDSLIHTLNLTVNYPTYGDTTATVYAYELPYQWYEMSLTAAGDYTRVWGTNAAGCDSIVTLHLFVNTTVAREVYDVVESVCPGTEYVGRLSSKVINNTEKWTDSVRVIVAGVPTDSIYNYTITPYETSLPSVTTADVIAICGNAIDVTKADAIIQAHIANEPLYAPNAVITWYVLQDTTWNILTNTALKGSQADVTVKFDVATDCGVVESASITVPVETPTPENDLEMASVPAVSKYGERLLVVDLKRIENDFGWAIAEEDVTWYLVVNGIDNYADPSAIMDDQIVATGYYCSSEDGTPLPAGQYYARINHEPVSIDDCGGVLQTVLLSSVEEKSTPMLAPSVVKPSELIRLMNLDPETVSNITVYTTTGELIETYQASETRDMLFNAADVAGYYIVEVQTGSEKVALRYIVK